MTYNITIITISITIVCTKWIIEELPLLKILSDHENVDMECNDVFVKLYFKIYFYNENKRTRLLTGLSNERLRITSETNISVIW